jgi:hypothetical protein
MNLKTTSRESSRLLVMAFLESRGIDSLAFPFSLTRLKKVAEGLV